MTRWRPTSGPDVARRRAAILRRLRACFDAQSVLEVDTPALSTNTAAYIQSWLKALSDDKQMVVKAASQAQKAVDFILCTEHPH